MLHQDEFNRQQAPQVQNDEHGSPLRLLAISYGLAAVISIAVAIAGAALWTSLLVYWLGGAALVFLVGLISTAGKTCNAATGQTWTDAKAQSVVF